jgi:uncharacterized protein (DUF736 family)
MVNNPTKTWTMEEFTDILNNEWTGKLRNYASRNDVKLSPVYETFSIDNASNSVKAVIGTDIGLGYKLCNQDGLYWLSLM